MATTTTRIHAEYEIGNEVYQPMSIGEYIGNLVAAIYDERITEMEVRLNGAEKTSKVKFVKTHPKKYRME